MTIQLPLTDDERVSLSLSAASHDLHLDASGNLALVVRSEAIGQHAKQRLLTFSGEWFLDTDCGVRWLEEVMGRSPDTTLAEALVKAEILNTDGVTGIDAIETRFRRGSRGMAVPRAEITTIYDERADL